MYTLASYIMRGRYHAALMAAVSALLSLLLPPLSYLSGAGIGLVTLRHGAREGVLVTLVASIALGVLGLVWVSNPFPALAFLLIIGLPLCLLGAVLRATVSLGYTLMVATLLGVVLVIGLHLAIPDLIGAWSGLLDLLLRPALTELGTLTAVQQEALIGQLAQAMTALLGAGMVLSSMLSLFIARWWQAKLYNPGGFKQEFHGLRLNRYMAFPTLAILGLASLAQGELDQIATELLVVILVLYMVQGLALVHRLADRFGAHLAWLVALYGMMLVAPPEVGMVLAAAGFADTWVNFRARLDPASDNKPK